MDSIRRSGRARTRVSRFSPIDFRTTQPQTRVGDFNAEGFVGTQEQQAAQAAELDRLRTAHVKRTIHQREMQQYWQSHEYHGPTRRDRTAEPSQSSDSATAIPGSSLCPSDRSTPPPNMGREGLDWMGMELYRQINDIVMDQPMATKLTGLLLEYGPAQVQGFISDAHLLHLKLTEASDRLAERAMSNNDRARLHANLANPAIPPSAQALIENYLPRAAPQGGRQHS